MPVAHPPFCLPPTTPIRTEPTPEATPFSRGKIRFSKHPTLLIPPEPTHTGVVDVPVRTLGRRSTALLVKTDFSPPTPLIRTTPPTTHC